MIGFRYFIKSTKVVSFHTTHVNVYCLHAQHYCLLLIVILNDVEQWFRVTKLYSFYCGRFC